MLQSSPYSTYRVGNPGFLMNMPRESLHNISSYPSAVKAAGQNLRLRLEITV